MTLPPRGVLLGLALVGALAVGMAMMLSGGDDDPEAQIRAALDRAAQAANARDVGAVMEIISEQFDSPGASRKDVQRALFVQLRNDTAWKRVVLADVDVELESVDPPQRAQVKLKAILAKGESKDGTWRDLAPSEASVYRFDLQFAREDDDWRVRQVAYRRAGLAD